MAVKERKAEKASASKLLAREKALEAIFKLPAKDRTWAKAMLNRDMTPRQGSDRWKKEHPQAVHITDGDKIKMATMHEQYGVSFRALERIFHLVPNAGNGAQRCVEEGKALLKARGKAKGKRAMAVA